MSVAKLILPTQKSADTIRAEMLAKGGDLSGIHLYHNNVLGMVYVRETFGSIIASDGLRAEDTYQGKVLLVLKTGPTAFIANGGWSWDPPIKPGDFVVIRPSDGVARTIAKGVVCRLFRDELVTEKLDHPDNLR